MSLLLNVLWVVFGGGFIIFIEYVLAGLLLCLTLVGIPFGLQCFKIAGLGLWPFGRDWRDGRGVPVLSFGFNLVWCVVAGLWIFISHVVLGVGLALTLIGIPFAVQHFKLALLALWPFGKDVG